MLVTTSLQKPQKQDLLIREVNNTKETLVLQPGKVVAKHTTVEVQKASEHGLGGEHLPSQFEEQMQVWGTESLWKIF